MKGKYSQKELLLLSNFVYIPACRSDGTLAEILEAYRADDGTFTEESVLEAARGGGMSCKDVKTVFEEMDAHINADPSFGDLSASRRLEQKDVRAVCYTDPEDDNAVVVFRGTGGTSEAWTDNFEGAFYENTRIQRVADDFVRYECAVYDDIVVTGHSKGGNMAQYVTVRQHDRVLECVSYDGQGFGDELIQNNAEAVKSASPKITSISAYNDFVNILLTCIAGTTLYVANESSAAGAHSSVTLLTENSFDNDGNFTSVRSQGVVSAALSHITDLICDVLSPAPEKDKETMSDITGSAISLALSTPPDEIDEDCIAPTLGKITAAFIKKTTAAKEPQWDEKIRTYGNVDIDTDGVRSASQKIYDITAGIGIIAAKVNEQRMDMTYSITARLCAEKALESIYEDILRLKDRMDKMAEVGRRVSICYEAADSRAAALMNSAQ